MNKHYYSTLSVSSILNKGKCQQTQINYIYNIQYPIKMYPQPNTSPYQASYLAGSHMSNVGYYPPQLYGSIPINPYSQMKSGCTCHGGLPNPTYLGSLATSNVQLGHGVQGIAGSGANHQVVGNGAASGAVVGAVAGQQVQGVAQKAFSRVEYIPYESYYIDYQQQQFVQNIVVPIQKKVRDYYAVQHVVDYVPKQIEEVVVQYVPQETFSQKLYYVPVQTQIVHMPQTGKGTVTHQTQGTVQGVQGTFTRPAQQTVITSQQPTTTVTQTQGVTIPVTQTVVTQQSTNAFSQAQRPQRILNQQVTQEVRPGSAVRNISPNQVRIGTPQRTQIQAPQIQNIPIQRKTQVNTVTSAQNLPPAPGAQFRQPAQVIQTNQAQLLKKASIPQNTNVQYQYSTRTVRNLSTQEISAMGLNKPGIVSGSRVGAQGQTQTSVSTTQQQNQAPILNRPPQGQNITQQYGSTLPILIQGAPISNQLPQQQQQFSSTSPILIKGAPISNQLPQQQQQQQFSSTSPILIKGATLGNIQQPQQFARTQVQQSQPAVSLMKNDQVDLTDSEHIDITKSKFNAQYAVPAQQSTLGGALGTNASSSTNPNLFSFNKTAEEHESIGQNVQANRISGGSIYDYNKLGDY